MAVPDGLLGSILYGLGRLLVDQSRVRQFVRAELQPGLLGYPADAIWVDTS